MPSVSQPVYFTTTDCPSSTAAPVPSISGWTTSSVGSVKDDGTDTAGLPSVKGGGGGLHLGARGGVGHDLGAGGEDVEVTVRGLAGVALLGAHAGLAPQEPGADLGAGERGAELLAERAGREGEGLRRRHRAWCPRWSAPSRP